MRKIGSKYKEEKRQKRNQIIVGVALVLVMLFSTLGFAFNGSGSDDQQVLKYNSFNFVNIDGYWVLELGNYLFSFYNFPDSNISYNSEGEFNLLNSYSGKPLYLFSEDSNSESEIYRNLFSRNAPIVQRVNGGCLNDTLNCPSEFPIKTCDDIVILIMESDENKITQDNNCVFIEGKSEDLLELTDEFLYKIIGVKN